MPDSVSLCPLDVADFADRLLHALPELRGQLGAALSAGGRAAAASSPATAGALRASGGELQRAVQALDTSMGRLAAALHAAAEDLIAQDAAMWGQRPGPAAGGAG